MPKYLFALLFTATVTGCCSLVGEDLADAGTDGGRISDAGTLPRCSPLGGLSGTYCNTTDDGKCMTTTCACTDGNGKPIEPFTVPMVGHDAGECQ